MNQNDDFINNTTSINIDYSDYSNNKLPLWAKRGLKINDDHSSTNNNLVHNARSNTMSSTPNRTRINLYNGRSTDSDERNSDGLQNESFESPIDRLKKKAQQLSTNETSIKMNGSSDHDVDESLTKKKNPLYVSTENLKYNDNFFAKTPLPKSTSSSTQLTLNKPNTAQKSGLINSSTPKLSNNNLNMNANLSLNSNSLNNSLNSSVTIKSTTSNTLNRPPAMSKRREELAKALSEARAKLQNLTDINRKSTGGLSTSMSVANLNRLSLNLPSQSKDNSMLVSAPIQKANLSASISQSQNYENDAVRRSISLSDLSHTLNNRSLSLKQQQQIRGKLSPAQLNSVYYPLRNFKKSEQQQPQTPQHQQFDPPQGLWNSQGKQEQFDQQQQSYLNDRLNASLNASRNSINQIHNGGEMRETPKHKPIRVRMSRSSSMASINKNDSLARNLDSNKSQGLWNSPSALSINTLRSNSSAQNSFNKFNNHHNNKSHHRKASSDDESSSDENDHDLYHRISQRPSTPPKPMKPSIRQLRRSSTTSNNLFPATNNASNNSANLTLQQQNNNQNTIKSTSHKQSSSNRKSWSNNFELRPAKSEYNLNLNSMGQETVNSPSSGFWSNQSNSGNHQMNGKMMNGSKQLSKQTIAYENFDLTNINPAMVPLSSELFQHVVDELNHLSTFAKKIHYRAQAEENEKLCNLLKDGISKAYLNLATIVPFSSNNVLPIAKSLNNSKQETLNNNNFNNHHHNLSNNNNNNLSNGHHADSSNTDHDTEEDINMSSPLNNNATVGHVSLTSDSASSSLPQESFAMNLLQLYSERLMSMVENKIGSKDK